MIMTSNSRCFDLHFEPLVKALEDPTATHVVVYHRHHQRREAMYQLHTDVDKLMKAGYMIVVVFSEHQIRFPEGGRLLLRVVADRNDVDYLQGLRVKTLNLTPFFELCRSSEFAGYVEDFCRHLVRR